MTIIHNGNCIAQRLSRRGKKVCNNIQRVASTTIFEKEKEMKKKFSPPILEARFPVKNRSDPTGSRPDLSADDAGKGKWRGTNDGVYYSRERPRKCGMNVPEWAPRPICRHCIAAHCSNEQCLECKGITHARHIAYLEQTNDRGRYTPRRQRRRRLQKLEPQEFKKQFTFGRELVLVPCLPIWLCPWPNDEFIVHFLAQRCPLTLHGEGL